MQLVSRAFSGGPSFNESHAVVGGRWHAFDLANELNKQGHLHKLITNYPTWFVKKWGIPPEKVVSLPITFWVVKAIYKIGGEKLMMRCQWSVHRWFAERAANYLSGSELIHGWSQWSEPSFEWAQARTVFQQSWSDPQHTSSSKPICCMKNTKDLV